MTEYKELAKNPVKGIAAAPVNPKNIYEWEAFIRGPEATPYQKGTFRALLSFPKEYPMSPPKMRFTTPLFHPNVFPDGRVCISILHPPGDDPTGYENANERWSPVQSIEKILLSVLSMIAEPNCESPANVDAAYATLRIDLQAMGKGNVNKAQMKRERNQAKAAGQGKAQSQLKANASSMSIICKECGQSFMCTTNNPQLQQHAESKHSAKTPHDCFPDKF
ncbi:MAG: putative Ubiquitin-conjugating enzyme E2 [Streblomastix strix]|uniref:Putative Ubiquitin-conjugating enzyme E2 n=1 Tax=Streblomastix strix TaxID=222440 RepID=A0A5J4WZK4_9EUKA|nr:MAG: putative Ubiquitin-conjugating enzyme E2 [Streblomastix strix]